MPHWILNVKVIFKVIMVKIPLDFFLPNYHLNDHIFAWNYCCYDLQELQHVLSGVEF